MARIDRSRLSAARMPFAYPLQTRFADADVQGHINNVRPVELLQEARVAFNRHLGLIDQLGGRAAMVAGIQVDFAAQLDWATPVRGHCGVLGIGRTSWTFGQLLTQDDTDGTYAETTMVLVGPEGPMPLPGEFRGRLENEWISE